MTVAVVTATWLVRLSAAYSATYTATRITSETSITRSRFTRPISLLSWIC
jgi:hypothetical protein